MSTGLMEAPMSIKPKRTYGPAKIDVQALAVARSVASLKNQTLADYMSDLLIKHATLELQAIASKMGARQPNK